jgi:hypothetical protein
MAQCAQLLTQRDVLAVPTSSRKLGVAIFTKQISQKFTLSNETKTSKINPIHESAKLSTNKQ